MAASTLPIMLSFTGYCYILSSQTSNNNNNNTLEFFNVFIYFSISLFRLSLRQSYLIESINLLTPHVLGYWGQLSFIERAKDFVMPPLPK